MTIGVCYFPEHWPRERWERDVAAMADAGFEYVRMGEFAWSRLEPDPGEYDLDWLADAVDLVHDAGMAAVLCTPTATPPKWLVDEHPDIRQEERDGTVRAFGGRRHYCFNSPTYRTETERIVTGLAEHFASHPGVAGWQTDNEFGCHDTVRCYCEDCAAAFRDWLRDRYGDTDALNEAWGTAFWSQHHTAFAEVDPPRHVAAEHHPSRLLDFRRFASDSVAEYNALQAEVLREADDDWFVTHNFMGQFEDLDAGDVGETLDFAAWDSYPTGFAQFLGDSSEPALRAGDPDQVAMNHDLYRGVATDGTGADDTGFWVMEQQPGDVNWAPHAPQPAEGAVRLWAHHAVAHGADAVLYFRWRRCLEGQEQYHAGLRRRDGSPDRGFAEARTAAAELAELPALGPVDAPVALLHDYENLWALDAQPHAADFDYWGHLGTYYGALRTRGVAVDIVPPGRDLSGYGAVVVPTPYLLDAELADRLAAYVAGGGHLLVTMRAGVKDPGNRLRDRAPPGPLADLVGATVERHESLPRDLAPSVRYGGDRYGARTWAEWLAPDTADAVGTFCDGAAEGEAAIVADEHGDGTVSYVGTWPRSDLADTLVTDLLERAGLSYTGRLPDGVRVAGRGDLAWVTNFTPRPVEVHTPAGAEWVLGEGVVEGYDLGVVRAEPTDLVVERN